MKALLPRVLQPLARWIAAYAASQPRLWRYVIHLRQHYATKMPPLEIETTFEGDIRLRALLSDHIESQLFWQGYQEADRGVLLLIKKLLPRDGVFIDVGANIGSFTLVGARSASDGEVHAFEPSAYHGDRLSYNIALNRFTNVAVNRKGLHDKTGRATLFLPKAEGAMNNSGAASLYSEDKNADEAVTEEVELIRLDDYVRERPITRLDLIKIDVEGSEYPALLGAIETLKRFRPKVIMELDKSNLERMGGTVSEMLEFWKGLDYRVSRIGWSAGLTPIESEAELIAHQNLLCEPELEQQPPESRLRG